MSTRSVAEVPKRHIVSISPLTGELLREYEQHSDEAVENKLRLASETFREYRKASFAQRSQMMSRAGEVLESGKETFARMMTQEMGKPFRAAIQEAEKCAFGCRYYAQNAERFLADEEAKTNATRSFVRYQPLGPVLAVMPWNFPFWQVFRFAAPGLMAGNVGLLKHASNVPLDRAVETAVQARVINNGQSCIAAKRFIVHQRIAQQFEQKFVQRMALLKVGDPMDPAVDVGPLATADGLRTLQEQVNKTVQMGARVLLGGKRINRQGNFFEPTALSDIPNGSPALEEELFGPVASLFDVSSMADAIRIANDSKFGLGACAWTNDEVERDMFINEIESGMAFVNGMVASDPRIPFGGVKHSGYGRELSYQGIREFVNVKTVFINDIESPRSETE